MEDAVEREISGNGEGSLTTDKIGLARMGRIGKRRGIKITIKN